MLIYFNQQKLHKGNLALGKKKKKLYTVINQVIQSSGKAIICNCRQSKSRSPVTSSLCFLMIYAHPVACWCYFLIFPTSDFSTFGMSFPSVHDSHSVFPSNPPLSCCCESTSFPTAAAAAAWLLALIIGQQYPPHARTHCTTTKRRKTPQEQLPINMQHLKKKKHPHEFISLYKYH